MPPKQTISQETFDAAVQENIDEFEMEPEEASKSAVEEFKLQGVDLANIITAFGVDLLTHPAAIAVKAVEANLEAASASPSGPEQNGAALRESLNDLSQAVQDSDPEAASQSLIVAGRSGAMKAVLKCVHSEESATAVAALGALAALMSSETFRKEFLFEGGPTQLCDVLTQLPGNPEVLEATATAAEAAAAGQEQNKCGFVDCGFGAILVEGIKAGSSDGAVQAVAGALRSFANADDARPIASRAFTNARTLAMQGAPLALLAVLKQRGVAALRLAPSLCAAIKKLAVNEDICKELADEGAVASCMQVIEAGMANAAVVRTAAALLRQLAGSDAIKEAVIEAGGLALLVRCVGVHSGNAGVLEQALGLLAALTLRNPDGAAKAVESGCVDAVIDVMGSMPNSTKNAQWVQRQACMSIRNIVARNPELRGLVLEKGAEPLLRTVKASHPQACMDVGSAALRDLGLNDYNT